MKTKIHIPITQTDEQNVKTFKSMADLIDEAAERLKTNTKAKGFKLFKEAGGDSACLRDVYISAGQLKLEYELTHRVRASKTKSAGLL